MVVVKQENGYLECERKLNSQELEKFKRKLRKVSNIFHQNSLNPKRKKRKTQAEENDQIILSKTHQEEQEMKSKWVTTKRVEK